MWFVSPQPQPGRVPDAALPSLGAAARALTATSVVVSTLARSEVASLSAFSRARDDACSGRATVATFVASSAETVALVATDAVSSRVAAPAICARSTTPARTAAVNQIARWFISKAPIWPEGPCEFPLMEA